MRDVGDLWYADILHLQAGRHGAAHGHDGREPLRLASGAIYNAANQPLNDGTATRTYNSLLQMTSMATPQMNMTYTYTAGKNNGQVASSVDAISGETITYQDDALKRLSSASGKNWGETYTYDGYGNLTQMTPTGTAGPSALSVTVALDANSVPTNRISATAVGYDYNGNQTAGFGGLSLTYDETNRLSAVGGQPECRVRVRLGQPADLLPERQRERALELIESYWGGMVKAGADTFWEAYDPSNATLSPYHKQPSGKIATVTRGVARLRISCAAPNFSHCRV
jgi:hypothetical protein